MRPSAKEIEKKYSKANSIKSTWDSEYRDIFEYSMPARNGYDKATDGSSVNPDYQNRRENLYSSVGEQSANEFVNTMQETLSPPMTNWISLVAGIRVDESKRDGANKELDTLCEYANEYKNISNYDMAFSEFCYDVYAGTGCLLVLPGTPLQPLRFKAIPLREYCVEEGANSEVRGVYRKYSLKRELLGAQWDELKKIKYSPAEMEKEMEIIESTYFDYDLNVYHYQVIDSENDSELLHREYKTNPFIVLRWNKCAGEPYGRGVGMTALNDIKTLNLIKYYSLRNLAYNLPVFLVEEDGMLDVETIDLAPGSLNVVPNTSSSVVPLNIQTDFNIESYKTQELEMQIKKNTYGFSLPNEGDKQLTATEVITRKREMQKSLNSVFGRILSEFQMPLIRRMFDILGDTGVLGQEYLDRFDVNDINGLTYKVNIVTPMARILKQGEAQSIMANIATLAELSPDGSLIQQGVKVSGLIPYYLELNGMPSRFINSKDEVEGKQAEQANDAQKAQQQAMQADVQVSNAKEMGKAEAKVAENEA